MKEAIEKAVAEAEAKREIETREHIRNKEHEEKAHTDTYTDRTRRSIPVSHAKEVAKAELQKWRVRMTEAVGMLGEGIQELTEKQLVEKANLAIGLMDDTEMSRPAGAKFVGANKSNGQGVGEVMYEMNTKEAADWIRESDTMKTFISKMGSTVDYRAQTHEVVFDWVPTSFNIESKEVWEAIEIASGIRTEGIQEARWIKPTHLRSPGQRSAIAILGFDTREDANVAIRSGLFIEGKKVWGRKQTQEPRRCLKCQCFGMHKAAKCTSTHKVCGRCAKHHRTNKCTELDQNMLECANC
ncbi:hypothetical protein BYT27DRAFT_7116186 [Phlegmacium glaucopus]|nr:hypothetical protein BYT27DRAFT_7116186 [Phlegmacium glaucopus]